MQGLPQYDCSKPLPPPPTAIHDRSLSSIPLGPLKSLKGIEVGHVFYLGKKYSRAFDGETRLTCFTSAPVPHDMVCHCSQGHS